ncbi:hypothetical protein BsWGS_09111 [Bradybaena similaris]
MSPKACYLLVGVLVVFCVIPVESQFTTEWWWRHASTTTAPKTTTVRGATALPEETNLSSNTSLDNRSGNATSGNSTKYSPSEGSAYSNSENATVPAATSGQKPCNNNNINNNNSNNSPIKQIDRGTDINLNIKVPRQVEKRDPNSGPLLEMLLSINDINE